MWVGNLFNAELCKLMEEEVEQRPFRLSDRIKRILALTRTESDALVSYYVIDKLCDALSLPVPPAKRVVEALRKEGFQAYRTHFNYKGIRSDAPASKISAILHKLTNRRSNGSV